MTQNNLGGITIKEVITFQTQIMMGSQFGRVSHKKATAEDIMIACLRMGWNDAFRHTSKNKEIGKTTVLEAEETKWRKNHKAPHDDFICGNILNQADLINAFVEFACATSTANKVETITKNFPALSALFGRYKETTGDKELCFGHFQKMFNIAVKLYVCLYVCREWLELDEKLFRQEILNNMENADCPIDSIILGKLASDTGKKEYNDHKWSKYGTANHPTENYEKVQGEISKAAATDGNSRLYYDFVAWKQ